MAKSTVKKTFITASGNQAAAKMAFAMTEAAAIYPITPSSDMAEYYDVLGTKKQVNILDSIPKVVEMQSEAGAAGTLHGLLAAGALATTFTASQGLLLKIPNMYKIAGELLPCAMHVSARTIASHALSIFGDHSDVMAVRATGWAMLCSSGVQEAQDMALVAHLVALKTSYPFLHFFDGFRTSHEFNKIESIEMPTIKALCKTLGVDKDIKTFRTRALNPGTPHQHGTAQNPDTFFQNREACNNILGSISNQVHNILGEFAKATGRNYEAFEYFGDKNATDVVIAMASSTDTIREYLENNASKKGLVKIRLYRPFDVKRFIEKLPSSCKTITVLDRTKENGSVGEPLYVDVCTALVESGRTNIRVLGGRYGLSSKEFTPEMVHAVFENMNAANPKNHFTVGINDDVSFTSLEYEKNPPSPMATPPLQKGEFSNTDVVECKFFGLGSDGTVSANKNSAAIINDNTTKFAQVYFVYDSKKSGGTTISHLRFSDNPINRPYLVHSPSFIACHNQSFLGRFDILDGIREGGTFLLNTTYTLEELDQVLPTSIKKILAEKKINFYIINAYKTAASLGLKSRINTIMQSAFFYLTNVVPYKQAVKFMKTAIDKTYASKGTKVLEMNYAAVDSVIKDIVQINVPQDWANEKPSELRLPCKLATKYYKEFCHVVNTLKGNDLPVSAFMPDGRVPTATGQYEKRNLATMLPEWIPENCIQCNICSYVCPHATIRPHLVDDATIKKSPKNFTTIKANGFPDKHYRIQINPHDCTGCGSCANVCPSKNKALVMKDFNQVDESANYYYSLGLPYPDRHNPKGSLPAIQPTNVKNSQFLKPYFEFSGACAGCGETPYIKLVTQLFGDRMIIANATGCSSIFGGSSPTVPYTVDEKGRGPAWANSLFEDNAEFGYGIKLAKEIEAAHSKKEDTTSVWIVGGDGWAYDIGYGGLDHILAQNLDVNILVLDTQVYSNTGGQVSKATPAGAMAKFAAGGKIVNRKDLGAVAMAYDNVYVAQVAMGANYAQTLTAIKEAQAHKGPSIIIAYSTCIGHGIDMSNGMKIMKNAVDSGYWILFRRKPATDGNDAELILDSGEPKISYQEFLASETRYKAVEKQNPEMAKQLFAEAEDYAKRLYAKYKKMSEN